MSKAVALAACARACGIPARLGFADVRNHLTTEKLRAHMGTDVFYWHGYTELFIDHKWVKATPAFNLALCEKAGIKPLEFNGQDDSIYHPFDQSGRQHMQYLQHRGHYIDVPIAEMLAAFRTHYSLALSDNTQRSLQTPGDFAAEIASKNTQENPT